MTFRLHILPETPPTPPFWACAEIRLINPLSHPSVQHRVSASYSLDGTLPEGRLDAVIVQRGGWPDLTLTGAQELVRAVRARGAKLIYDIDDDLLCPHPIRAIDKGLEMTRPIVQFLAYEADLIICSTDLLAERMAPWRAPKQVWRNALDERMFGDPDIGKVGRSICQNIGYAGTPSHLRDLLSITESLRGALTYRSDRVGLEFIGTAEATHLKRLFGPLLTTAPRSAINYRGYLEMMQTAIRWDIAIAPLLNCDFNTSKSDIKFLEYAAFGIPGVYSSSHAYDTVIHGELGIRAQPDEFGQAVQDLLDAPDRRRIIAQNAREYVIQHRTLATCSAELVSVMEAAL